MNLLFNQQLVDNASKIFDIYLRPTHKSSEANVKIYSDAMNSTTTTTVPSQSILFVSTSFLTIVDKISAAFWNESFDLVTNGEKVKLLVNTLFHGNETQRNSALDKLVNMGIIASGDTTMTRALASRMTTFDPALMGRSFVSENTATPFYKYTYNIPLGLEKKYDIVRNTQSERLFLFFPARGHVNFGYSTVTGENFGHLTRYWNEASSKESLAIPYLAVDLGDMNTSSDTAIKYDHLDVIEYFDNLLIQIAVTNLYN